MKLRVSRQEIPPLSVPAVIAVQEKAEQARILRALWPDKSVKLLNHILFTFAHLNTLQLVYCG
jgi:hypothetical protein